MNRSYHNTTESFGADLERFEQKAKTQEEIILEWFRYYRQTATPSKLLSLFNNVPITSIRRAMTNLTASGELVKTHHQRTGLFGRPEHVWRLAEKQEQQELF